MGDALIEVLLPRTDLGALAQALGAAGLFSAAIWAARRSSDLRLFLVGLAVLTAAFVALRAVH